MSNNKVGPKTYSRNYSKPTLKIIFGMSGNECAKPECSSRVIANATNYSEAAVIAQIAHIYAVSDNGPRGKPGLSEKERNHHSNLLLLCPTCHVSVDAQYETYPASLMRAWKFSHERKFSDALTAKITDLGHAELEVAAKSVMIADVALDETLRMPIAPSEKLEKNDLSPRTISLIKMGSAKSHDVEAVLVKASQLDESFPERLRDGFKTKYREYKEQGLYGDDMFDSIYVWSGGYNSDPMRQGAALCILSHLFIVCDVFES